MEVIGKSVVDELVCNLQYSLPAGASYVQERRSSTFFQRVAINMDQKEHELYELICTLKMDGLTVHNNRNYVQRH